MTPKTSAERVGETTAAYRALFRLSKAKSGAQLNPSAETVLADLARQCYVTKTTAQANPTAMAVAEGRRQVWLHIQKQLRLTDAQIHYLTTGELIDD